MTNIIKNYKDKQLKKIQEAQKEHITSLRDLTGDDDPSLLFYFLADKLGYLLENNPELCLSEKGIALRKDVSKLIRLLGPKFLSNPQVFENKNILKGISTEPDPGLKLPQEPVIWVANHGFKDDVLASIISCKRNAYILFGSLPQFYNTFDGMLAWANGVCMANRKVSSSRRSSVNKSIKVLEMGADILIFPEGVWNKTPNNLLLPFWPGVYHISKATGAKIIPIVHYLRDPFDKSKNNKIHTVIDDPMTIDELSENEAIKKLRDTMATWYYLLLEKYGQTTREELLEDYSDSNSAWEDYLIKKTAIPDRYDTPIEISADYRSKSIIRPEEVWSQVANLNTSKDNVLHVEYAKKLVKELKNNDFQRRF